MSLNLEDLQRYLDDDLTDDIKKAFEKELSASKDLQKKLSLLKEIDIALSDSDAIDIRAKFEAIHKKHNNSRQTIIRSINIKRYWAAAAVFVALIGIGALLWINTSNKTLSNDELYSMYYENISAYNNVRSSNIEEPSLAIQGYSFYEQKEFIKAVSCFNGALVENPNDFSVRLYLGLSYMETEDFNNAISEFNLILDNKPNLFTDNAEWLLGLCFLKTNDIDNAVKQFELVSNNKFNIYSSKANEVLESLVK